MKKFFFVWRKFLISIIFPFSTVIGGPSTFLDADQKEGSFPGTRSLQTQASCDEKGVWTDVWRIRGQPDINGQKDIRCKRSSVRQVWMVLHGKISNLFDEISFNIFPFLEESIWRNSRTLQRSYRRWRSHTDGRAEALELSASHRSFHW